MRTRYLLLLLVMGGTVLLLNLGGRDLWEPDETRYAVIAKEMRESGNWILPHLNGQIYAEKPPLFFWLVNLSTSLFGNTEFANRLPSALAGLITVLVTFLLGERLFNANVGFLSGLVLANSFFFPQISRWMMLDSLFTLFSLLTVLFFYQGYKKDEGRRLHYLLAGMFMGLGVLTKGPIAYLPIPVFLILGFFEKDVKRFWNRDLLWGFLLSLAVALIWVIPACLTGGEDYARKILFGQAVGRLAGNGKHIHPEPFYFYLVRFPLDFLPWTAFLAAAFFLGFQERKEKRKECLLLFIWSVSVFLFFTFSTGKKDNYILPLYPAASMLVGRWFCSTFETGERLRRIGIPLGAITLFFLCILILILLRPSGWIPRRVEGYLAFGIWPLIFIVSGGFLSCIFLIKRWGPLSLYPLIVASIISQVYLAIAIPRQLNESQSVRPFSRQILRRVAPGEELKIWKFQSTGLLYYTGRSIEQIKRRDRLIEVLSGPQRVFLVVEEEDFIGLKRFIGNELLHPVERAKGGHQRLLLFSNQAG